MNELNKFFFVDHVKDIWAISRHKGVDLGVAFSMFHADVRYGAALEYNSDLPTIDFATLHEEYMELEKAMLVDDAISAYQDFKVPAYKPLRACWLAGDLEGMDKIVEEFKKSYVFRVEDED